jgi:hypothetical protein
MAIGSWQLLPVMMDGSRWAFKRDDNRVLLPGLSRSYYYAAAWLNGVEVTPIVAARPGSTGLPL